MSKELEEQKEDTAIVFLAPHRHGGVDYQTGASAMVTAQAATKLISRKIADKADKGAKATKAEGAA